VTVAAVVLAGTPEAALADAAGRPAVRRIAETAWAGGAIPVIVVAIDPEGSVAAALTGSEATLVEPLPGHPQLADLANVGVEAAAAAVAETDAVLLWPAAMSWVDPETITSLIQAHGLERDRHLRPTWEGTPGWPVLVAGGATRFAAGAGGGNAEQLVAALELGTLDLGDPGTVIDLGMPIDQVPGYRGPAAPIAPPPDWGAAAAEIPET
jgi:molybdenum cofactor cytidylyltransferase